MLGAAHSLSWDFLPGVPQGEAAERRVSWKEKPLGSLFTRYILKQPVPNSFALPPPSPQADEESLSPSEKQNADATATSAPVSADVTRCPTPVADTAVAHQGQSGPQKEAPALKVVETEVPDAPATPTTPTLVQRVLRFLKPLSVIVSPVTITLAISLPIALIAPLKALFVDVSDQGGPVFLAPDNRPPLAFTIDTGTCLRFIQSPHAHLPTGQLNSSAELLSRLPSSSSVSVFRASSCRVPFRASQLRRCS